MGQEEELEAEVEEDGREGERRRKEGGEGKIVTESVFAHTHTHLWDS